MIRRHAHGLCEKAKLNALNGKSTHPDPRSVINALARRASVRMIVDGITVANDIVSSDAAPANIILHIDARHKSVAVRDLTIHFEKSTAPLAGRPAMRAVKALHRPRDTLKSDAPRVRKRMQSIRADPTRGSAITVDLSDGLSTLPTWMRAFLLDLIVVDPDNRYGSANQLSARHQTRLSQQREYVTTNIL
jgi:hypothetical protein